MDLAEIPLPSLTFANLPLELLVHIAKNLDKATALSFARVQAACTASADYAIWRDIDLRLPPYWGTGVLVEPYAEHEDETRYHKWQMETDKDEEAQRAQADIIKLEAIQGSLSDQRARMVRTLRVTSRSLALGDLANLLNQISPNLQSLIFENWEARSEDSMFDPNFEHLFQLTNSRFPALETVRLASSSIFNLTPIFHLCNISPRLTSLHIPETPFDVEESDDESDGLPKTYTLDRDTALEKLYVVFVERATQRHEGYIKRARLVLELIGRSPNLRQLSVKNLDILIPIGHQDILKVFTDLKKLEDLHWPILGLHFLALIGDPPDILHSIRRLVLTCSDVRLSIPSIPSLPNLEIVVFDSCVNMGGAIATPDTPSTQTPALHIQSDTSYLLETSPKLRVVYILPGVIKSDVEMFDQLDIIQERWIWKLEFASILSGGEELFIASHSVRHHQFSDCKPPFPYTNTPALPLYNPIRSHIINDDAGHHDLVNRIFNIQPTHQTQVCSDYLGAVVPNEVLDEMKKTEGVEEFVGRGIAIKEETLSILVKWKAVRDAAGSLEESRGE